MDFLARISIGISMFSFGLMLFLVEYKALPHRPKNPEKWDELHAKYYRQIKLSGRIFLLLGLTFILTAIPNY
ncbi:MAG: hypothetical protein FWD87_05705 [Spirochaetaceae bacterium]|nr:hypothetical protein [Spirochaetaceae bacterium]